MTTTTTTGGGVGRRVTLSFLVVVVALIHLVTPLQYSLQDVDVGGGDGVVGGEVEVRCVQGDQCVVPVEGSRCLSCPSPTLCCITHSNGNSIE
ncbi:hypothetical protein Pmani_021865 [Petrolisthes manimaculis]|uniref:Uncharacterized protein n=1 Tax=Petrolisthes manimaculis TaxID=1843537 RepID=A0AAE1PFD2_9EUCA|nr:hypothetical protein Pmani_021865 [Petrolisthes manimaculis]